MSTAGHISEKELLGTVLELCEAHGWRVFHVFDTFPAARVSSKGFPDLTMVKNRCLLFVELKSEKGKLSQDQMAWMVELGNAAMGIDPHYYIWRPTELLDGTIERILEG